MSTYREIVGKKIKKVSSDPSSGTDGEMWYNSTTGTLRGPAIVEAWVSTSPLGTGRYQSGSFGTQTAGVAFCGAYAPSQTQSLVEEYNGTGWSEETNFPAAGTAVSGAGTQTAGLAAGGNTPSMTTNAFTYDGSSWTAANAMPYAANNLASCGLAKTSVIYAVGRDGSSGNSGTNKSLTFDGTNFAAGPTLNTTRMYNVSSGSGTGTAGLVFGGFIDPSPNAMTNTESYNGSSWSNESALNVATGFTTGFGIQTNTVTQVKTPNYQGSEKFDGTSWTALPDIGVSTPGGLYGASAGSTGDAGFVAAMGTALNQTAEWTSSLNTITAGAWASGGVYPLSVREFYGIGSQTAGLGFNGTTAPGITDVSAEYDGTNWGSTATTNATKRSRAGAGSQAAGLAFGGEPTAADSEEYNGSSWTSGNAMGTARYALNGAGTQAAGLAMGGRVSATTQTNVEEYDGTNWTAATAQPSGTYYAGSCGTQTAGLVFGNSPGSDASYEYDGTNWTTGGTMTTPVGQNTGAGTQTAALQAGGNPALTNAQGYDGTAWSTRPSLSTGRHLAASSSQGTTSASIIFGGNPGPGYTNTTESFTGETSSLNIENFTTS